VKTKKEEKPGLSNWIQHPSSGDWALSRPARLNFKFNLKKQIIGKDERNWKGWSVRGKEPGREKRERNREDREYREKWNCRRGQRPTFFLPIPSLPFPSPSILSAGECGCTEPNGVVKERRVSLWIAFSAGWVRATLMWGFRSFSTLVLLFPKRRGFA